MAAIRKGLLHQTATYYEWDSSAGEQGAYKTAVNLTYVRYETSTKLVYGANGSEIVATTIFYYDNTNSTPTGKVFKQRDKLILYPGVTGKQREYKVLSASMLVSNSDHHQEVLLQ